MSTFEQQRAQMVNFHLARRGITEPAIIQAFQRVPREAFVPPALREFAYRDTPLPLSEGQTISQPYIVALTVQALRLTGSERVLEVGTGSGYAAAILSCLANDVTTIERIPSLAASAQERLREQGFRSVHVHCGDGSLGWPAHAPYDAIAVAAGGPKAPPALLEQLAIGGRLVIPIGSDASSQVLTCITRDGTSSYRTEAITDVRFVPLIGQQGWNDDKARLLEPLVQPRSPSTLVNLIRDAAEPISDIDTSPIDTLLDRIGDARLVLIGEATHGTSEFYRMRARITKELIARRGFQFVAVEADWPDAARVDDYVRGKPRRSPHDFTPFARFPTWMWRNQEVHDFVDWLRAFNARRPNHRVGFHGLDLYSLFTSIGAVLAYLDRTDPDAAKVARSRYGTLTPWQKDPAAYGAAVLVGRYESSEKAVVAMLRDLLEKRVEYARKDEDRFFDASQNARLVADAEHYYREIYYGAANSWNLRDTHMFDTLQSLLGYYGPNSKGIVWEHNSHVGDASATDMNARGEHNVGELCRKAYGDQVYIIGFGTDHGTVAAAHDWDEPMERMQVVPARNASYERVFHETEIPAFSLALRNPMRRAVREELTPPRLERAIGVIYRPQTELQSHYFSASLPRQFDEYIWFDETNAISPLEPVEEKHTELPETYPFGV